MLPATVTPATDLDLATLNRRLAAQNLPAQTAASLAARPTLMNQARIEHALRKAEGGDQGAWRFLSKHLPASGPAPQRPAAMSNADTAPASAPPHPTATTTRPVTTTPAAPRPAATTTAPTATYPVAPRPTATPNADTVPAPAPPHPPATTAPPDRVQCRVYGGKAALCIEPDETRQGEPTLRIEAARATAPRKYDWRQKLSLQLTREELPVIAATVLGFLTHCEYKNHGPNQDKGLEIVHQGTHLYVRLFQKDRGVVAVPVTAADSYALGALCLRQLRKTAPWLSDQGVMTLLKLTVQRMVPPTA